MELSAPLSVGAAVDTNLLQDVIDGNISLLQVRGKQLKFAFSSAPFPLGCRIRFCSRTFCCPSWVSDTLRLCSAILEVTWHWHRCVAAARRALGEPFAKGKSLDVCFPKWLKAIVHNRGIGKWRARGKQKKITRRTFCDTVLIRTTRADRLLILSYYPTSSGKFGLGISYQLSCFGLRVH